MAGARCDRLVSWLWLLCSFWTLQTLVFNKLFQNPIFVGNYWKQLLWTISTFGFEIQLFSTEGVFRSIFSPSVRWELLDSMLSRLLLRRTSTASAGSQSPPDLNSNLSEAQLCQVGELQSKGPRHFAAGSLGDVASSTVNGIIEATHEESWFLGNYLFSSEFGCSSQRPERQCVLKTRHSDETGTASVSMFHVNIQPVIGGKSTTCGLCLSWLIMFRIGLNQYGKPIFI